MYQKVSMTVLRVNVWFVSHQPSLQGDGVDVEVFDQSQVVVHVFQAAQHLQEHQTDESFLLSQWLSAIVASNQDVTSYFIDSSIE